MQIVVNLLGGFLALGWTAIGGDYVVGARRARNLEDEPPYPSDATGVPSVSVVLAACNEEEKLPGAFRTLIKQDYPGPFEIVAVNDRSTDATPALLQELAREGEAAGKRVVLLSVENLPPGWLGKTHAQYQGARNARGQWLLFTDADIHFTPDALSRAVRYAEAEHLQHLVTFMRLDLRGFWENTFGLTFAFLFFIRFRPHHVSNPRSSAYLGVGGFNLVRRDAYEAIGSHQAIALEVADDMELGRRIKHAGFRSGVVGVTELVRVRWQEGLSGLMNGLTKNAYAGLDYSPVVLVAATIQLIFGMIVPLLGVLFARSPRARLSYGMALAWLLALGGYHARTAAIGPVYALMLPFSTILLITVMWRSAWTTERNGGISWRGTFYPLALLRARPRPALPPILQPLLLPSAGD